MATTYVLIHGASSDSFYWYLVAPRLRALGHDVVTPDMPVDDDRAGFEEYTDAVVSAIGDRRELIVVAQSLAGFVGPMVCDRVPVDLLVMLAAMTPKPGESGGEWWTNTDHASAMRAYASQEGRTVGDGPDVLVDFFHDVPSEVREAAFAHGETGQTGTPFAKPWPLTAWPAVPTKFLLCTNDRMFPAAFQRRVVKERLGITPDELESGHLPALAHPAELVERLERYRTEVLGTP